MNASRILKLVLVIEIVFLLGNAMAISRDYQDSWILEGLEIPFAIFMLTNTIYFLTENNNKWLVLFATLSRFIIALLPNLKYEWFLGTAGDQHKQFRFSRFVYDNGYVEVGGAYSETPSIQILFASYSEITGIPILHSFKYLPGISWLIYPPLIYSVIRKIFPEHKNSSLIKYALFISSMPIMPNLSYIVTGTLFGSLFVFLCLSEFLKASEARNKRHLVLAIVFSLALVYSHTISSFLLLLGFLMVFLANKIIRIFQLNSFGLRFSIFLATLNVAWIMTQFTNATAWARIIDLVVGNFARGIVGIQPEIWSPTGIRLRFFDLSFLDGLKIITVFNGGDIIVLLLAAFGIIVSRKLHPSKPVKFLSLYFLSLWLFVPFQLLLTGGTAGLVQHYRIIRNTLVICPILGAIFFWCIDKKMRGAKPIVITILLMIIALSTIETYGYQPLLPSSSTISESLPSDEPVVFLGWLGVNSIYQRSMIQHIEKYISLDTRLAADHATKNQIIGLANYRYSDQLIDYNPLSKFVDENVQERGYDFFMIHFPGKSGGLAERAEMRTRALILAAIQNSSVSYTNGESFVLAYSGIKR